MQARFPPFSELDFDLDVGLRDAYAGKLEEESKELYRIKYLAEFGRPLCALISSVTARSQLTPVYRWNACLSSVNPYETPADLINLARTKLLRAQKYSNYSLDERAAVLSLRILLDVKPTRTKTNAFLAKQVASHMRVVHSVEADLSIMHTSSPSEPILVEAAANIMQGQAHKSEKIDAIATLCEIFDQGHMEAGKAGELITRLFLTLARDKATRCEHAQHLRNPGDFAFWHRPVTLKGFLEALLSPDAFQAVWNTYPVNIPRRVRGSDSKDPPAAWRPMKEAFGRAVVNFTHWSQAMDSGIMKPSLWPLLWARAMAFETQHHEPGLDEKFAILLDPDHPELAQNQTAGLVETKNREKASKATVNAKVCGLGSADKEHQRPYLVFIFQSGVAKPSWEVGTPRAWGRLRKGGARYEITLSSVNPAVFGVVKDGDTTRLRSLLDKLDLIAHHPRPCNGSDPEENFHFQTCIDTIIKQKPWWKSDAGQV